MHRTKNDNVTTDSFLELLVREKIRLGDLPRTEEGMEYLMNINVALSGYSEAEIRKMKAIVEGKQRQR